ncbi:hypothetical protein JCM10450v2_007412 [Rhodotorula kratochvilovae]
MAASLNDVVWPTDLLEVLDKLEHTQDDLADCGPAVVALLLRLFALLRAPSPHTLTQAAHLAAHLLRLADEKLNSYPYKDVPLWFRRLYTDSALLGALARLVAAPTADECRLAVHDCDMALVIAGAPGPEREELALALIRRAQAGLAPSPPDDAVVERPAKRARVASPPPAPARPPPYIHRALPTRAALPSFVPAGLAAPFVVRGALADSDAVARWRSLSYLRRVAGPARVVPVEVGGDYTAEGWGQRMMDFDAFLDALELREGADDAEKGGRETLYLAQHALFAQFPALRADLPLPDLVYSSPSHDAAGAEYAPPGGEDGLVLNAWLGPGGTKSAAHTDPWWNCYVQVVGSKWVWVAPPVCGPAMAAFGAAQASDGVSEGDDTPPPGGEEEGGDDDDKAQATELMTNTSTLDVSIPPLRPPSSSPSSPSTPSVSPPPPRTPDIAAAAGSAQDPYYPPAFRSSVASRALQAVLEPGDVLVLPPRWWHSLVALERSFSVSVWF